MKGLLYRSYHIVGIARLNQQTGYWQPKVRVLWHEGGQERKVEFDGPAGRFRTKEDAEDYAISLGKDWINNKNPVP